ncbi:MAG: hypothetical protein P8090_19205 [Gammaproteobacteria bacterium]
MNTNRAEIEELIYESCMTLDQADYGAYMDLYAPEFNYRLTAYSPEVKEEMTWLNHDRDEMADLFRMASRRCSTAT